jgi:hypothetical protein
MALATASPILVRLCTDVATIGRAAGLIYALSTAGSMAGIVATIFWLLPHLGTHATLQIRDVVLTDAAAVFTDDLAPVEEMTRRMLR